ncbi:MAG: hypothetical protein LKE53_09265 [Oscillospiraceae bacterium]|jgi:hypothetical protein|nr:hypothetical protein [Oscillospiraceae bacterium]MDD3260439.1 hypothetical protein [Oscillospiraceae bacterium]
MTRAQFVRQMLQRAGAQAVCGEQRAPAVLRPLRAQDETDPRRIATVAAGFFPKEGDTVLYRGQPYTVLHRRRRFFGGEEIFALLTLEPEGEEAKL